MSAPEIRAAAGDYTCSQCGARIPKGAVHLRTRGRSNGARTSVRSHLVCPRVTPAVQMPMPGIGSPEYAELMKRAAHRAQARLDAAAIPTRPVPKHYSEAGEKKGWSPAAYIALAIIIAVIVFGGLLLASSYWRGL